MDRNRATEITDEVGLPSLSARRAWIEISVLCCDSIDEQSLSARRAWIEIN